MACLLRGLVKYYGEIRGAEYVTPAIVLQANTAVLHSPYIARNRATVILEWHLTIRPLLNKRIWNYNQE
jgi:hypothetical protein